jgi:hypothetical protein
MIGLVPEEFLAAMFQMACYGFAALTAVAAFFFAPRA